MYSSPATNLHLVCNVTIKEYLSRNWRVIFLLVPLCAWGTYAFQKFNSGEYQVVLRKELTKSDVANVGRIVLPKVYSVVLNYLSFVFWENYGNCQLHRMMYVTVLIFCRRMLRLVFHHWCKVILWYCRWMTWCFLLHGNLSIGMISFRCCVLPRDHNFFPEKSWEVEGIV